MLEAKIERAEQLKKILDAIKELVTDANWDCSEEGMKLQAMDNSHIALVSLELDKSMFQDGYRCDRNMSLGMNLNSLQKILKCAGNDDEVTLRADDDSDALSMVFQNRRADRMGEYEMKLMDIDQEHLSIPDTQYDAQITMPSSEFLRIVRDIKELGESVKIEVTKEGIKFSAEGDIGTAAVTVRPTSSSTKKDSDEDSDEEDGSQSEDEDEPEKMDEDEKEPKSEDEEDVKPDVSSKKSKKKVIVGSDDEEDDDEVQFVSGETPNAKRKRADSDVKPEVSAKKEKNGKAKTKPKPKNGKVVKGKATTKKAAAKGKGKGKKDEENRDVIITLSQSVALTFSIKYLINFAKSTPLSDQVQLHMSNEVPLLVAYEFGGGAVRFYLAPKISDE